MARQLLLAFRLASYVATFIPLVVPNTLFAGSSSGVVIPSQSLSTLSEIVTDSTRCSYKKIAPRFCFLVDSSCGRSTVIEDRVGSHHDRLGGPVFYGDYLASPGRPPIQLKILETGYSLLKDIRGEESGYGLYSYALMVNYNSRSAKFLSEMFSAIPSVEDTAAQRGQTNIFYIPIRKDKVNKFPDAGNEYGNFFVSHTKDFYDYKIARSLLNHLCGPPAEEIRTVCEGDLSRGPYIFSYAQPASKLSPVPPPFLFMDLSDVHERAFPEIIAAFRAQVKRDDISDRAKIDVKTEALEHRPHSGRFCSARA
jgi:hypothetical protein